MAYTCNCCSGKCRKSGSYRNRNRIVQRFFCEKCGKSFSETQPLDGLRLEHSKVVQITKLLTEGLSVRATARFVECHPRTVLEVLKTIGEKCAAFHDRHVRGLTVGSLQIDELWARTFCSQKRANQRFYGDECGDQYTYLGLTARERFIVSFHTGKRDEENTETFVADVAKRIDGRIQITSDSFAAYPFLIRKYLLGRLDFATMQKKFDLPKNYIDAARRYSPAPFVGVRIRVKAGAPRQDRICTSHVERCNLTVRHFNRRFARLSLAYSRTLENHRHAVALFACAYNWCKIHSTLGCTPAVGLRLATENWTIERLIEEITKE